MVRVKLVFCCLFGLLSSKVVMCELMTGQLMTNAPDRVSWLSIAWDRKIEIFKLINTKLTKHSSWNLDSEVVGIQWSDDEVGEASLSYLSKFMK